MTGLPPLENNTKLSTCQIKCPRAKDKHSEETWSIPNKTYGKANQTRSNKCSHSKEYYTYFISKSLSIPNTSPQIYIWSHLTRVIEKLHYSLVFASFRKEVQVIQSFHLATTPTLTVELWEHILRRTSARRKGLIGYTTPGIPRGGPHHLCGVALCSVWHLAPHIVCVPGNRNNNVNNRCIINTMWGL